jgi:hypothetical protein
MSVKKGKGWKPGECPACGKLQSGPRDVVQEWRRVEETLKGAKQTMGGLEQSLADASLGERLQQATIEELQAKLAAAERLCEGRRVGWGDCAGKLGERDKRIAELEASKKDYMSKLAQAIHEKAELEADIKRLTERMRMAGVAIAAIREMAAPSGVGNDPNCTCSTCAHEFGQSEIDKESCKACRQAVIDHGTHPQWKRRDKQSAPESPEGIRWECCKECPKKQDCCRCGNFLDEVNKKLAEKERHHELEHKIILDLEAKLDITNRNAERADATIFDLQAKLAAADMKGLYWQMQFDYGAERYAEREKRIAELVFEGRALSERIADLELLNLNRAAEINRLSEPLKAHCCPTCTRWNQQRDHAGDGCHDCKTTSFEHWQSYLPSGEGKSSEGKSNWINNPHPEVMALWNRCIKAEEELAVAQKSASRRLEVINEKNEDLKRLEEQVKQLKYKNEQLAQLLGTADAQVKRMRACMNCWYGNEEVCRIKDFKECNYDHWKPSQVALKGMEGYLDTGKMRRGDLVEFKDGGKSAYYRITSVVTGVPFQRTASSPYWPKCGLAAGTCPQQKSMGPADILCGDPTYPCTSQIKKPEACKDRTADCQIDDCTDCDKQDEPKEAGK